MNAQPINIFFSSEHVWARVNGGVCRVGITSYAQEQTGEIIYVDLPPTGMEVRGGDPLMEIESSKVVAEVYAPVSGKIVGVNEALEDAPDLVNQSPHDQGWLVEVSLADPTELESLMTQAEYEALTGPAGGEAD